MKIISVGFEGPNRCGKGVQIDLLSKYLSEQSIAHIIVRGDGSRPALGDSEHYKDFKSLWWDEMNEVLHSSDASFKDWDIAAKRLIQEISIFRHFTLPSLIKKSPFDFGYILLDRTILSRVMVCVDRKQKDFSVEALYPGLPMESLTRGEDDLIPDLIFLFTAPVEVLVSRLHEEDPKYYFRRRLIEKKGDWYEKFLHLCPQKVIDRVTKLDATLSPEDIHKNIVAVISDNPAFCGVLCLR